MKLKVFLAALFWVLLLAVSCNREEISFQSPSQELKFSKDTLFLDTVYNQTRSETYAVKVYNKEDKDIKIPKISLEKGNASLFRINVDGKAGTEFFNVSLRKNDSLFIFIEIAPVANAKEAIAQDNILFDGVKKQSITLLSVVQDAEYFIQSATNPNIITENTTWNNSKAKIIYGNLTIAQGKTLTIEKGTKVYFHKNAALKLSENAVLNANGDLGEEITFRGDRNDTKYDTIPNNWNGISLAHGAAANITYAKIFGGETALTLKTAKANLKNTIIHTFQSYGISAENSQISAENLVMNNFGEAAVSILKGGKYSFTHSTIANFWQMNYGTDALGIFASNADAANTSTEPLSLILENSIIFNKNSNALVFKQSTAQSFSYYLQNCLIKYEEKSAGFAFENNANIISSIKNSDPKFENYFTYKMNLKLKSDSPAKGKGNTSAAHSVPLDLVKTLRTSSPSLGAYQ